MPLIHSHRYWNHTVLQIAPGRYEFEVTQLNDWRDFTIPVATADGYLSQEAGWTKLGHALLEKKRRRSMDRWFALIGSIDENEANSFLNGSSTTVQLNQLGELTCYANDVALNFFFYHNNHGTLQLRVKRLPHSTLKSA